LKEVFKKFDLDGDQIITPEELRKVMEHYLNEKLTEDEIRSMMDEADVDANG